MLKPPSLHIYPIPNLLELFPFSLDSPLPPCAPPPVFILRWEHSVHIWRWFWVQRSSLWEGYGVKDALHLVCISMCACVPWGCHVILTLKCSWLQAAGGLWPWPIRGHIGYDIRWKEGGGQDILAFFTSELNQAATGGSIKLCWIHSARMLPAGEDTHHITDYFQMVHLCIALIIIMWVQHPYGSWPT